MKRSFRPSANGPQDSICTPRSRMSCWSSCALEERVGLDLVDRGRDLVVLDEVDEPVGVEVGDPDRLDQALAVQVLHGPPGAVVVAEGLVDQVQVEVVEAEPLQRLLERSLGAVLAGRPGSTAWW